VTVTLAPDQDLPTPPIQILELDRSDLRRAQPEPHEQQHDRVVTPADRPPPIATRQQPRDHLRL
jgi:hypothetical protein